MTEYERGEREAWLRDRAIAVSRNGIIVTDPNLPDNPIVYVNPGFERITGYRAGEVLGRNCRFLQGEDRDQPALKELRVAIGEGRECRVVLRNYKKDGTLFWNDLSVSPVRDEEGRVVNFVGVQDAITERKQVEEALRGSEERYRALYENNTSMYFTLDEQGTILSVNRFGAEQLGYVPEELVGRKVLDIFHEEDKESVSRNLGGCLRDPERAGSWEARKVCKDGRILWVQENVRVVQSHEGGTVVLVVCEDITERKRVEEQILFQAQLLEQVRAAVIATDLRGTVTHWNKFTEGLYGWSREEAVGRNIMELTAGLEEAGVAGEIMEQLRAGEPWEGELVACRKDGSTFPAHTTSSLIYDVQGSAVGMVGISTDITERKRTEREIETRTHKQAVVAELGLRVLAGANLCVLMDEYVAALGRILDVKYCEVFELLPGGDTLLLRSGVGWEEGLVGKTTVGAGLDSQAGYSLLSGEPVIVEDLALEGRFGGSSLLHEHGVVSGVSVPIRGRDGPFGVLGAHATSRRSFTEDDVNFLQAVANVLGTAAEREKAEEEMREVREAERRRMARDLHDEALQDLVYALQTIRDTSAKSKAQELEVELQQEIDALERAVLGLRGAIYDLRLNEDRERTFVEMLGSLVELNRQSSPGREIELSVEEGFTPPLTRTRQVELLRIVQEALANVRRHSEARRVRVAVGASEGRLQAEVSDDGRGFDPAETLTGVGIKGMRERARALGGDLKIRSEPGEGTKVHFETNPAKDREEPEEEARILLVEDHASFRQAAASVFDREPEFTVVGQAGSLAEARRMLDGVDVAIVDLGLPDGYGAELIKELRAANPQAQALVLSANLDRAQTARAVESGAAGVLHKSAGMDEVVEAVRRLRAGEMLLPLEEVVELLRFAGSRREQEYEARQAIAQLTPRERQVLQALAGGLDGEEVAEQLHISTKTERNHIASIFAKLEVHSRLQALVFALRHGVVSIR